MMKQLSRICISICLVMTLLLQVLPVEAAKFEGTINPNAKLTNEYIPDSSLLAFLKKLVNESKGRDKAADVTLGELVEYPGEIILDNSLNVTDITGIGYARHAQKFDLSVLDRLVSINTYEFDGCQMKEVKLPPNISEINSHAFRNCSKLETISFPSTLNYLRRSSFQGCSSLNNITLPANIQVIEEEVFSGCSSLEKIAIPNNQVALGTGVFSGCSKLSELKLQEGMTEIPSQFLRGTTSLAYLNIPSTIQKFGASCMENSGILMMNLSGCSKLDEIGDYAFAGSRLMLIQLPDSLRKIGTAAFNGSHIVQIDLPDELTVLGEMAFRNCTLLNKVNIPTKLLNLNDEVFAECVSLTNVSIHDANNSRLETIGKQAFYRCESLPGTEFLLQLKSLKSIGDQAFAECGSYLKNTQGNPLQLDILGKIVYHGNFKYVVLPDGITLGNGVFQNNPLLEKVVMGRNIKILPDYAFQNCPRLESVQLSDKLEEIGNYSFDACSSLTDVQFPASSLRKIGEYAFRACGSYGRFQNSSYSKSVWGYVPKSNIVTERNGTEDLKEAYVVANKTFEKTAEVSINYEQVERVYIRLPGTKRNDTEETRLLELNSIITPNRQNEDDVLIAFEISIEYLDQAATLFPAINSLDRTSLAGAVFSGLSQVILPDSVTEIGKNTFEKCYNLKEVKLSNSIKIIPDRVFSECGVILQKRTTNAKLDDYAYSGLKKVTLPQNLTDIGNNAFYKCYSFDFENGQLPGGLQKIGDYAFSECASLSKLVLPYELKSIGNYAFYKAAWVGQSALSYRANDGKQQTRNVTVPLYADKGLSEVDFQYAGSLEAIGKFAFAQTAVKKCEMRGTIKRLEDSLFQECAFLETVTAPNSVEYVGNKVFADAKNLKSVEFPATAVLSRSILEGAKAFAVDVILNVKNPNLEMSYGKQVELPVYAVTSENRNLTGLTAETDDQNNSSIRFEYTTKKYVNVNGVQICNVIDNRSEDSYSNITVSCNMAFPCIDVGSVNSVESNIIASKQLKYRVKVTEVSCEAITFDRELYAISVEGDQELSLTPGFSPSNTTSDFGWEATNQGTVIEVIPGASGQKMAPTARIRAKQFGTSDVTLTTGAVQGNCKVNVVVPAKGITLSKPEVELYLDMEGKNSDKIIPNLTYDTKYSSSDIERYYDIVHYTSSNPNVVKVDQNGTLLATGLGTATVTAIAQGGRKTAACSVNVKPDNTQVSLSYNGQAVKADTVIQTQAGDVTTLNISTDPYDSLCLLKCLPGDNNIMASEGFMTETITTAAGNSGIKQKQIKLRAMKPGKTTISVIPDIWQNSVAELYPKSRVSFQVSADATAISLVSLLSRPSVKIEETVTLFQSVVSKAGTATKIENAPSVTTDTIRFSSSEPSIAKVDPETGMVTGVSAGTAIITVVSTHAGGGSISDSRMIDVTIPNATSVNIEGPAFINIGERVKYQAQLTPSASVNKVTFSAANSASQSIISVEEDGHVVGLAKGVASIKVTTDNGRTKQISITVRIPATGAILHNTSLNLNVNATYTLRSKTDYTLLPEDTTDTTSWTSQDPNIATVNEKSGQIKGVARGVTNIIGTTTSGYVFQIEVNVLSPATGITVNKEVILNKGNRKVLSAVITPGDSNDILTWSSSNEKIATVNNIGVVTAVAIGTCTVTVKTMSGRTARCSVKVRQPASSVKIRTVSASFSKLYLAKGRGILLNAVMQPLDTTDKIKWTSSNDKVATVTSTGYVAAKKKGTVKITAKADGGKIARITVYVVNKELRAGKVWITKTKTIKKNQVIRVAPKLTSSKSTDTLRWSSSNPNVAKVDMYGNITGLKKGKTRITVTTVYGKKAVCVIIVK